MNPKNLYRVVMANGTNMTVIAMSEDDAMEQAFKQFAMATGHYEAAVTAELAEGYDIA